MSTWLCYFWVKISHNIIIIMGVSGGTKLTTSWQERDEGGAEKEKKKEKAKKGKGKGEGREKGKDKEKEA